MYQFYYADNQIALDRIPCRRSVDEVFSVTAVRPTMWEEHCLECSAPACFSTCMHYQARSDGRCKRLENGLLTFAEEKACCGQGVHLTFRRWGNMMTVLFPAMLKTDEYLRLQQKNERLGRFLSAVESSRLPQSLRWQGIRVPEFLRRRRLLKLQGADNTPDAFVFHGYSYHPDPFRLIVEVFDDHTPVYKTALDITPGENLAVVTALSPACAAPGHVVKVYPENNLEATLDILWCDFVKGHPVSADKPAATVKCVVWDLDNTVWDGTLIETDDPHALKLKPGVKETMEELDRRGILQSVASKNDLAPAMDVLTHLGLAEYMLYPQIHWNPKSGSIEQIAKSLNIGIDSLAFIDDTAFERTQVSSVWPQVRTYDPADLKNLLSLAEFDVPATAESARRREMYRAEEKRNTLLNEGHADIVDFLRECHLELSLFTPSTDEQILRCFELIVRTNQLNMSGNKYSAEEFDAVLARPDRRNLAFSCADRFGDYGIVGFLQYFTEGDTLCFSEFAMSCRVAGKFAESALFAHLLKTTGCTSGRFRVLKTKKNILLRNTLEQIGFVTEKDTADEVSYTFTENLVNRDIVTICPKGNGYE